MCQKHNFSRSYFSNILKVLKGSFREACNTYGFIKYNPTITLRLPKTKLIKNEMYHDIPWQLFLKNKLLLINEVWEIIIKKIKNNYEYSHYFFSIDKYQKLNDIQLKQMFSLAKKSF